SQAIADAGASAKPALGDANARWGPRSICHVSDGPILWARFPRIMQRCRTNARTQEQCREAPNVSTWLCRRLNARLCLDGSGCAAGRSAKISELEGTVADDPRPQCRRAEHPVRSDQGVGTRAAGAADARVPESP